jgi:putative endonuclease
VKYRRDNGCGRALEAVGYSKQKKIISVARHYLMKHGLDEWTPCRFDVIAVDDDEVTVLKNAFEGSQ